MPLGLLPGQSAAAVQGEVREADSGAARSMSRIVSFYKSVSDTSPWPSACCPLLHTSHSPRDVPREAVTKGSGLTQSLQVAVHTLEAPVTAQISNRS